MKSSAWSLPALFAAGFAFALAGAASASPADKDKKQKVKQIVPTGAEDAAVPTAADEAGEANLERMLSRSDEGLQVVNHENGMASVDLEGRYMHASVAVQRADGSTAVVCVSHPDELARARAEAARTTRPAPVALEEK